MKSLIILLDLDDVVEDLLPSLVKEYNRVYGTNHTPSEIKNWYIGHTFDNEKFWELCTYEFLINRLEEKNNSIHYIKKWMDEGHEVYIVSDTRDVNKQIAKRKWLQKRIPYFENEHFIWIRDKYLVQGDIFVDDNIKNVRKWVEHNPNGKAFVMIADHNSDKTPCGRRVHGLNEVDYYIYGLEE